TMPEWLVTIPESEKFTPPVMGGHDHRNRWSRSSEYAIIIERDAYGPGHHRWHNGLLAVAEEFGFTPRVCQPYRAKTKGKVERFNGYLKGSFCVPLAATLKQAGLRFDVTAANAHIGRWLTEVADQRLHGTTRERPAKRF